MASACPPSVWRTYGVYGLTIASDFPFANQIPRATRPAEIGPDLTFTCAPSAPIPGAWDRDLPAYASPAGRDENEGPLVLHRLDLCDVLRFTGVADFYLWHHHISCHLLDPALDYLVEIRLLGPVLACWLERAGILALHAAAVAVGNQGVAFLSGNTGGKSVLAATLMQAGDLLLTDDVLAIEDAGGTFQGRPGYPTMRMWPEEARQFLGTSESLERAHPGYAKVRVPVGLTGFGAFSGEPRRIAGIYVPERLAEGRIEITPIAPREALLACIRYAYAPRLAAAVARPDDRLALLGRMVERIPVRRLSYPSGFEHLPRVRGAVLDDLRSLTEV